MTYIVDSNSWIQFAQDYPEHTFPSLWEKMGTLIRDKKIQCPKEVQKEIKKLNDLGVLFTNNRRMFKENSFRVIKLAQQIISKYPCLVKPNKKEEADPFIIALAYQETLDPSNIIVTQENQSDECGIPFVARQYNIKSVKLVDMFRLEGWRF